MLLVLWAFFHRRAGEGVPHYPIYLLIGIVQFTHFAKSTSSAMRALQSMRSLAVGVMFPKDILVYSAVLADLPELLISMLLTAMIGVVSGAPASWALVGLPLVVAMQLLLVVWSSLLLSTAHVFVHDLDHLFEIGMRILFFVTPIFYSLDTLSPQLRSLAVLNPLSQTIEFTRTLLLVGRLPPPGQLVGFLAVNTVLAYGALVVFRRVEPALLERL
jgi:ABC-type polysaccharide/polyol phosphate export permease